MENVKFLESLFEEVALPGAVMDMGVENYGASYALFFARNPALGERARKLFPVDDPETLLSTLVESANQTGFEMAMALDTMPNKVLDAIIGYWSLSESDLVHLCSMPLSIKGAKFLAEGAGSTAARKCAAAQLSAEYPIAEYLGGNSAPETSRFAGSFSASLKAANSELLRAQLLDPEAASRMEVALSTKPLEYRTGWRQDLRMVTTGVEDEIGSGDTNESLEAWRYFFALIVAGTDKTVAEILTVAKRLARADLQLV